MGEVLGIGIGETDHVVEEHNAAEPGEIGAAGL